MTVMMKNQAILEQARRKYLSGDHLVYQGYSLYIDCHSDDGGVIRYVVVCKYTTAVYLIQAITVG